MDFRFASWNVRSLYRPGAIYQLQKELKRYRIHIAALQEVRWPGEGECNVDNISTLFYSGASDGKHIHGTGFMVDNKYLGNIIKFHAISERLCILRVSSRFSNISIVNAYAPTELAEDVVKDQFYDDLEAVFDQLPEYDVKMVVGDLNAKIGREEIFLPTIGRHSKHEITNDNGYRLVTFAAAKSLVVKSTMFPHKDIYKGTWKSSDGVTINQIDHVLIDNRHKNTIEDVRCFRGADCDTDHYMLGIKMKTRIKVIRRLPYTQEERIYTEPLRDELKRQAFSVELNNRFSGLEVEDGVDNIWEVTKEVVRDVSFKILGKKKRRKRRKWWSRECDLAFEERRKLRILAEQNCEWEERYREARKKLRNLIRKCKRDHFDNQLRHMEMLMRANETRKFYQEVNMIKKGYQPTVQTLEDGDGNLISDPERVRAEWRQYFRDLLNCTPVQSDMVVPEEANEIEVNVPDYGEVKKAILRLKNNKCPGVDGIPGEIWKYGGEAVQYAMYRLILKIWEEERQPIEWNMGVICPIHKKGSKRKCSNYRGIALLPTAYKVFSYILLDRLEPYAELIIGDYQCGFRRNRSTVDQIFLLKQLMEKKWEYAQDIHSLFVDFTKAYDSIDKPTLFLILKSFGIPDKLIRLIKAATQESKLRVRVEGELTEEFVVATGLKQGDALSPMLFNLVLEHVVRKVLTHDGGVEVNGKHQIIGYADDLALLGSRAEDVSTKARTLSEEGQKVGLRVNVDKTEYFHMRRYRNTRLPRADLVIDDTIYKGADKFRYLGCTVTDTNERHEEIDIRIQNALRCSAGLHKILTSKLISRKTKIRVYKTVIRPILMYGCEAWTLTLKEENKLLVAERKILRKILGLTQRDDGTWRVRKNAEIEDLVAEPNIIGETKSARLRWLGHVERMGEDRAVKRVYLGRPEGKRPVGRPRYRWIDQVHKDLVALQEAEWQEVAQNRVQWRNVVSEAKIHFGSLSHRSK